MPAASYATTNPKRATTLYASDRDVFLFLVDPKNPVEVGGEQLFRGFYTWNSEVGAATFGLTTFLYRYVCDNRIIWGASDVKELRIRHTGGAPERFGWEGERYLRRYAEESTAKIADGIRSAQAKQIPLNTGKGDTVESWLQSPRLHEGAGEGERRDGDGGARTGPQLLGHRERRHRVRSLRPAHGRTRRAGDEGGQTDGAGRGVIREVRPSSTSPRACSRGVFVFSPSDATPRR